MSGESLDGAPRRSSFGPIERLARGDAAEADSVLAAAFARYPVMQYVLDDPEPPPERLSRLVALFTAGRWLRDHPVLGIRADGRLVAVLTATPPGDHATPAEFEAFAERAWAELGADARERYDALRAVWIADAPAVPRWHVNMIGVVAAQRGAGHAARLLREIRERAERDGVRGVDLTTEDERNLTFYSGQGYRVVAHSRVAPALETWTLVLDV
jgi:GNAT superfamily N-acetyltransferase